MAKPLVSIIIPLYNAEKYIAATLASAIAQTWANKEIIVVDDESTDGSLSIAKTFESDTLKVFKQQNGGASAARNRGLLEAKGEYIQFLDADDLLSNGKIEAQIRQLIGCPEYLGLCGTVYFNDGDNPLQQPLCHHWYSQGSKDPVDFLIKLYGGALVGPEYGGMIQPNAWLTPRSLIEKSGPWNEMRNPDDDGEFFCRVMLASSGIVYCHEAVNYYRKFNTHHSLSGRKDYEALSNVLKSTDLKASHLLRRADTPKIREILSRLYYENAVNFYPKYKGIAHEAEKKAKALAPNFHYNPYFFKGGFSFALSKLLGWKTVRYIQYIRNTQ